MTEKLVIVGAGETAAMAYEYFTHDSDFEVVAFTVDKEFLTRKEYFGLPLVAFEDVESYYHPENFRMFVALAAGNLNIERAKLYARAKRKGYILASYVSSRCFRWHDVEVGENCFVLEDNTLQPFSRIGNNVTMWSGNHLGHRSVIQDNCFITSHVVISGFCEIGMNSYIGVNSAIADYVRIGKNNFIGMGSIINKSTKDNSIYSGEHSKRVKVDALEYFCR